MAKLTDTQLIVLSKATQREDGAAEFSDGMKKAAVAKVGASLLTRKLMREIRAKPGMPVWRMDDNERPMSLVILKAGRDAIGVDDEVSDDAKEAAVIAEAGTDVLDPTLPKNSVSPRAGSKQALVISMLLQKDGATLEALIDATRWLPHTTRAVLTGLRKRGFVLERQRSDAGTSCWRIVQSPDVKLAA